MGRERKRREEARKQGEAMRTSLREKEQGKERKQGGEGARRRQLGIWGNDKERRKWVERRNRRSGEETNK